MASPAMAPVQDDDDDQYGEISFSPAAVGVQLKDQLSSGNDYAPRNIYNHFVSDETGGATVMQTEIGTPDDPFPTRSIWNCIPWSVRLISTSTHQF